MEKNLAICYNGLDLEGIMLCELSQKKKDQYHMISLICRIQKTKEVNKHNQVKKSHRYREQTRWLPGRRCWEMIIIGEGD